MDRLKSIFIVMYLIALMLIGLHTLFQLVTGFNLAWLGVAVSLAGVFIFFARLTRGNHQRMSENLLPVINRADWVFAVRGKWAGNGVCACQPHWLADL